MSLTVPTDLLESAERGDVADADFVDCIRASLPYAWNVVDQVASELTATDREFADDATPPPSEVERGQLLRALASDAIRGALERHFGVKAGIPELPPGRRIRGDRRWRRHVRAVRLAARATAQPVTGTPQLLNRARPTVGLLSPWWISRGGL